MFEEYNLSDQALGAVMMALQKSLLEQTDIVPLLKGFKFVKKDDQLFCKNPPLVKFDFDNTEGHVINLSKEVDE